MDHHEAVGGARVRLRNREESRLLLIPFAPGIGDMVMMEPLLRAVMNHRPEWKVTMVARQYAADLLEPGDYRLVSPFYFVTRAPLPLRPLDRLIPRRFIARALASAASMELGPFDRVINLFSIWENHTPFRRWWTPQWPPLPEVCHTLDLLADYLEGQIGSKIPGDERSPRVTLFPEAQRWADSYLARERPSCRPLVSLVVSAVNSLKLWTAPQWAELNDRLVDLGYDTLLIAPRSHLHARQLRERCKFGPLWPQVGVRQMSALLARSDVVVGIDTGPLHVAAAIGVPWVGLFGASNPDLIGPYDRRKGRALVARFPRPDSCAKCWLAFKNREQPCATLPASGCTALLSVQEVLEAIEDVVRSGTGFASPRWPRSHDRR